MAKPADLEQFNVKKKVVSTGSIPISDHKQPSKLITKGFRVTPEAAQQFEMLRAELGKGRSKDIGPKLIAEALNMLFRHHGKPTIAA